MLNKLSSLFFKSEKPKPQPIISKQEIKRAVNDVRQVPRYPPFDHGVPAIDVESIIETQSELINRIKIAFGVSPSLFDEMVMASIRNYAAYVHLLPATSKENHNNAGGLFRLGLEVGFYALQSADGKIYSTKESAERRRQLHPKWVFATFIAGLCAEIHRPITTMSIVSVDGQSWPSLLKPLYTWISDSGLENYFIHWSDNSNTNNQAWHSAAAYVLNMVIPQSCLQYLNDENAQIVTYMTASIMGASRHSDGNMIGELVRQSRDLVIDKDIKSNAAFYGKLTVGSHLAPTIIDIMRELIRDEVWTVNIKLSRIWYTKEGCFIVWSAAFTDICNVMSKRKIAGIPASGETLAEMLLDSGLIEQQKNGSPYWEITLPGNPKLVETVKIADPSLILAKSEFEQSAISLLNPAAQDFFQSISKPNNVAQPAKQPATKPPQNNNLENLQKNKDATPAPIEQVKAEAVTPMPEMTKPIINKPQQETKPVQTASALAPVSAINPNIIDQISADTKRLLNAIKADMSSGQSEYPVWMSARGLVISREEFESHGIPHIKALDELNAINWLVRDPDSKRVIYKTEKDGVKINGYVINKAIALAIGFKDSDA